MDSELEQNDSRLTSRPTAEESVLLVEAIRKKDLQAEDTFVRWYQARVRAMMRARTRNADLAEDLLQDVLLGAILALRKGQLHEPVKLSAFVRAIARNVLNNYFRGAVRAAEPLECPENLPDLSSFVEKFETDERKARALEAIEELAPSEREILQMTLVDGLKSSEIADILGLSPNVVRQRKLRATRRVMEFVTGRSQKSLGLHLVPGRAS
jgi:RNA polymerase sigma-70 factor (ECF subfamily)